MNGKSGAQRNIAPPTSVCVCERASKCVCVRAGVRMYVRVYATVCECMVYGCECMVYVCARVWCICGRVCVSV